ncbi:type I glyceraldehyde-3-phosphate dehydrogenase [Flavihumibacter petaseus]|uniref:Glyceraldehyde-3-phosphate dehydrogenase n=1 Tax=Flavihumibacter petaseus NBRC 106054 TaxID=1220578 RepID=A0A0E9N046_9BACT|nr:glyceraldehyde 3-phosphate dehydrogenase NAD-binding domain-containing protein [Flavihumibacter petaseus]GAO43224.1 glyceraldehyde-3-phosphate dehydrogenase [Flavihumibacter petaseus NBRC 106054]
MRIAINGMGRIGRLLFRRLLGEQDVELVAVNDIMPSDNLVYLLKYDSLYGPNPAPLFLEGNAIVSGDKRIMVFQEDHPAKLNWKELGVDVVLECSGRFHQAAGAKEHLQAGAKAVLLSTTGSADIPLMIYGFNQHQLTKETQVVSPGGCMTNCCTHIIYLLQSIGIESIHFNILHSYTSRQELVDTAHKQFRRGRAAAESIIPVEIDLASSLERLFPLKDRIAALSIRVPVTNGAMTDVTVTLKTETSAAEINNLFRHAATGPYKGILDYTEEQLVSADIKGNTHSLVIDGSLTSVAGRQVKLIAWFDNEYGYTSRMIDWLRYWQKIR